MTIAVITIVAGRHRHLRAQRRALAGLPIDVHVVVSLGDDTIAQTVEPNGIATVLIEVPRDEGGLPLAAGRNAGARAALDAGADLLVFLDVDCLPGPELPDRYRAAALLHPRALLCGPVTYLPPHDAEWTTDELRAQRRPHPARPDPEPGSTPAADPALFWSLSFATTAQHWADLGGFDEAYVGYGAEDTDLARRADDIRWVGGADAFHQHHPTSSPPMEHVDEILSNGRRFASRWNEWPMGGWLDRFDRAGLIHRDGDGWVRAPQIRLASIPARHAYVSAVRPRVAYEAALDRGTPDPLWSPDVLRAHATELDVVHVHFGYEHLSAAQLAEWVDVAREVLLPVVVTVHDLRNPHLERNDRHVEQLRTLLASAAEVITLTEQAAAKLAERYGRAADVLAHPTVVEAVPVPSDDRCVTVPLGLLRRNVVEPAAVVSAVAAAARTCDARVRVTVRREAVHDPRLRDVVDDPSIEVCVHDRLSDAQVAELVAASHTLVLPYRFGTHSGWLEIARDVGTSAVAPSCGCYAGQWPATLVYGNDEYRGLERDSLIAVVSACLIRDRPAPADRSQRLAERELIRARHEVLYRRAMAAR